MKTRNIALCALLSALGVVVLSLGSLLDSLDLTVACITSLLCLFAVIELGVGPAFCVWGVTSVLSFILLPVKFTAFEYFAYAGLYPILKYLIETKIGMPPLRAVCKFVYYAVLLAALYAASRIFVFEMETGWLLVATAVLALVAFVLFDFLLSKLVIIYHLKWRKRLRVERLMKK